MKKYEGSVIKVNECLLLMKYHYCNDGQHAIYQEYYSTIIRYLIIIWTLSNSTVGLMQVHGVKSTKPGPLLLRLTSILAVQHLCAQLAHFHI